jgi:CoA:oxalate CoA-transferase
MTVTSAPAAAPSAARALALDHLRLLGREEAAAAVDWDVTWHADDGLPGSEATCQALAGLMALHGGMAPRRLGLDVASAAAGILAAQGVLAALLGRARGGVSPAVRTSLLDGALAYANHQITVATAAGTLAERGADGVRPPFPAADGSWVELEAVSFESWAGLFRELGAGEGDIDAGWGEFARRYVTGHCALPPALHECTRRLAASQLEAAATRHGLAACRARSYDEVLADGTHAAAPWSIERAPGAAPTAVQRTNGLPLDGITVTELTSRLQGPLAGRLLFLLGADVVKVEPPGGDPGRMAPGGPFRAAYLSLNRGKHLVEIDYMQPAGRRELRDLVARSDVFLHNARPGRVERLGLAHDDLRSAAPGLVHVQLAGWDPAGPHAGEVAGDYVVQAWCGCGSGLGEPGRPPFPSTVTLLDVTAGLLAAEATIAALLDREEHGGGGRVATTLEGAAAVLQRDVLRDLAAGTERGRRHGAPLWGPLDRPMATAEGWLAVDAAGAGARRALAEACGVPAGAPDDELVARLSAGSAAGWEERLIDAGLAAAAVRDDLAVLPGDPRLEDRLQPLGAGAWAVVAPWRLTG